MAENDMHRLKISGPQMSSTFVVPQGTTTIGRHADNDLNFIHPLVSRRHARLECKGAECYIVDAGSTHGTMVNKQKLAPETPHLLQPSDVVEIGAFWMLYERTEPVGEPARQSPTRETSAQDEESEPESDEASAPSELEVEGAEAPSWDAWEGWDASLDREETTAEEPPDDWEKTARLPPSMMAAAPPPPRIPGQGPSANGSGNHPDGYYSPPPGLSLSHTNYIKYLPDIYWGNGNDFIIRFLALLESILEPIKWNVDNFDLYLDPRTAPSDFLPWLASWFDLTFDESWTEESRRTLLAEAHKIYRLRGTVWALSRLLEIYTGFKPEIDDQSRSLDPFTFLVRIPLPERQVNRSIIEQLIDANKPAHTSYQLLFQE